MESVAICGPRSDPIADAAHDLIRRAVLGLRSHRHRPRPLEDPRRQETMSAVTIPNIPAEPSACVRMWQWNAHTPGLSATTIASHRSPGATLSVSHLNAAGSG